MTDHHTAGEHFISPEQLCIGLHVHLDLTWTEHPFTFSSFKIKSQEQIATIQGLGLSRVRYSPGKSDVKPLPSAAATDASAAPATPAPGHDAAASQAKRERMKRVSEQRAKAAACQKELLSSARTVKLINQNVFAQPEQTKAAATTLIKAMADSMMVDADVSIQLMADKVGGEEVYFHSLNVSLLSMMLAKELKAPMPVVQMVGMGALFHDIGELEIPDRIVRKLEPRTKAEQALMQMHCEYGLNIARKMSLPNEVLQVIAQHHEKVDGSGYPAALNGTQLSLMARIVSLVNAYDELCNPPNPAKALTPHEALSTMFAQQRNQYDQLAMSTFVRCMGVYPPGTLTVLSNDAIAMVVSVNTTKPLRPVVLVYDPAVPKEEAIMVDLEAEPDVSITKAMRPQQLSADAYAYLSPRKRMTYYFDADSGKVGS
jgi:putative nucleotidyltransferase with HDIG domain